MGALVAGVGLSTFPYNLDVIAKVVNIRDFFVTLFFVALGMQIPAPTPLVLALAALGSLLVVASRFLSIFPLLYSAGSGLRGSLLPTINLSQMSEFSLVIAALGLSLGHVDARTVAVLTFVFAVTSVSSTYMIQWNHEIQGALAGGLVRLGLRGDAASAASHPEATGAGPSCSSASTATRAPSSTSSRWRRRARRRSPCCASCWSSTSTPPCSPSWAAAASARSTATWRAWTPCTTPGRGGPARGLHPHRLGAQGHEQRAAAGADSGACAPQAEIMVASDTLEGALALYEAGADFVFIPRIHSAHRMAEVIRTAREEGLRVLRDEERALLGQRREVLA